MSWRLGHYLELLICPYCQGRLEYRAPHLYCSFHQRRFPVNDQGVDFRWEKAEYAEPLRKKAPIKTMPPSS